MSDTNLIRRLTGFFPADENDRRRAFVQTAAGFAVLLVVYSLVIKSLVSGSQYGVFIPPFAAISSALIAWWAARAKSITAPAYALVGIGVACVLASASISGGINDFTAPFLIVAPIIGAYFLGSRSAVICGAATIIGALALTAADVAGWIPETPYPETAFELATGVVIVFSIAMTMLTALLFSRRAEKHAARMAETNELLSAFARTAPVAVAMVDRSMRYLEVSDRWLTDYGLDREAIIGRSHYDVFPEITEESKAVHARCLKGETERSEGERFLRANGEELWLLWEVRPWRDARGAIGGVIMITRDITEQRRVQERLEAASREAREASAAKSAFLATMSHEIRTPLNAVIGLTEALLDTPLDERQRLLLTEANKSGTHLLALISDILDLSKLEAGKVELNPAPFSLQSAIAGVAGMFASAAESKGVALDALVEPGAVNALIADENRLKQILINLVGNALKFTHEGRIDILARTQETGEEKPLSLIVEVRDSGIGIEPDRIPALFDAFTQADASTTRRYGGTGLGLAICRRLAEEMDGTIACESAPAAGAVFRVTLPVMAGEAAATQPAAAPTPGNLAGLSILFVDDNAANRLVYEEMAKKFGCACALAATGRAAVALCEARAFDVIIMDIEMPDMDGLETAAAIRALPALSSAAPIIAVTAHALKGDRERFLEAGMIGYLSKPVSRPALSEAIARAVTGAPHRLSAERAASADDDLVNHAIVADLAGTLGGAQGARLFAELWGELTKRIAALEEIDSRGDAAALRRIAHEACGLAANLGAAALSKTLKEIELAARDGRRAAFDRDALARLEAESRRGVEAALLKGAA